MQRTALVGLASGTAIIVIAVAAYSSLAAQPARYHGGIAQPAPDSQPADDTPLTGTGQLPGTGDPAGTHGTSTGLVDTGPAVNPTAVAQALLGALADVADTTAHWRTNARPDGTTTVDPDGYRTGGPARPTSEQGTHGTFAALTSRPADSLCTGRYQADHTGNGMLHATIACRTADGTLLTADGTVTGDGTAIDVDRATSTP